MPRSPRVIQLAASVSPTAQGCANKKCEGSHNDFGASEDRAASAVVDRHDARFPRTRTRIALSSLGVCGSATPGTLLTITPEEGAA